MSDELARRVDELMRERAAAEPEVPVLTEVVSDEPPARPALEGPALEALARELERAVLERVAPELERILTQALERAHTDLKVTVTQMIREAVAASVARALASPRPPR